MNEGHFRKKLSEEEILKLSETEISKLQKINESTERMEQAEANKESQQKLRILFERAPSDALPFLVYCIYVAAAGLSSFFYLISKFEGNSLYILLGVLLIFLVLPIFIIPKKFLVWKKKDD